jgi:hypothetical protein
MRWIINQLSDAFPYTCFYNWFRGHDMITEKVWPDARKLTCIHCGLSFGETDRCRIVWDDKFQAVYTAYLQRRR